jgi:DMSO/TMAO reductase YedYZ molybdopterin-dependent catalytic subunit
MFYGLLHPAHPESAPKPSQTAGSSDSYDWPALRNWPATFELAVETGIPTQRWEVAVGGDVAKPRVYRLQELMALPTVHQFRRLVSCDGWTYRAQWTGIRFRDLMNELRPAPSARFVRQVNASGQVEYTPVRPLIDNDVILCFAESDKPLTPWHGGPVRLMVFDRYCYKGLGQIVRLDFVAEPEASRSQAKGWSSDGAIVPGKYYAFDQKNFKSIDRPGEVTQY